MESQQFCSLFPRNGVCIAVPSYQRAYSWEKAQWQQLIDDLKESEGNYYLGHFLFEHPEGETDSDKLLVIDGQQRLTTLIIFFSCLRHALSRSEEDYAHRMCDYINNVYLRDQYSEHPHFHTVEHDDEFFVNEILNRDFDATINEELQYSSQKRIRDCRIFFDSVFSKESISTLLEWKEKVERATVTQYHVFKKTEATQVFAFQNDRGKHLSNLEVLKSYFLLAIYLKGGTRQSELVREMEIAFRRIYESIFSINLNEDDVLRYFWMAYSRHGYNTENPLAEIKKHFKDKDLLEIRTFIKQLARAFALVSDVEEDATFEMANLKRIHRMAYCYPLLIKSHVICKCDEQTYYRLTRFLENIIFRAAVRGGRAAIESRLHSMLLKFDPDDAGSVNKAIDDFIAGVPYDYWNDNEIRTALSSRSIYSNPRIATYILWRYEQSLCPKNYPAARIDWEGIIRKESLEHIAPQTRKEDPMAHGYGVYNDPENPEQGIESGGWLNCIGNLLLLSQSQNSAAGNKDFSIKLGIYDSENSLIRQQQEIKDFVMDPESPIWDKACIEKRLNRIVDRALGVIWNFASIDTSSVTNA